MKQYVFTILITWLITYSITYALSQETTQEKLERENKAILETYAKEQRDCYDNATGSSIEISQKYDLCKLRPKPQLKTISWDWNSWSSGEVIKVNNAKATTGSVIPVPPKWYTKKHTLILTGSHDYRQYAHLHPWVAWWRNNNPSGMTWWVSNILKWLWNDAWIDYKRGTARPKNEKGYYILFGSVEHGIRAKMISIRERWWKATVSHFLAGWWTDSIKLSFPTDKLIMDLSEQEFMELFVQQLKKESPWYISQLVKDWILIITH